MDRESGKLFCKNNGTENQRPSIELVGQLVVGSRSVFVESLATDLRGLQFELTCDDERAIFAGEVVDVMKLGGSFTADLNSKKL